MSESNALVSIIMNCYNSDRFLKNAIDSIYSQTYNNWEIIFWDNNSTDKSAEIAKSYDKRLVYYKADKTTALGEARNLAMAKATGEYIAFLDCDDLYFTDKIQLQVSIMNDGDYNMCYGSVIVVDENETELRKYPVSNKSGNILEQLLLKYEINIQSVMVRYSVLKQDKLSFNTDLRYCPDHNLFMELASRYPVGVINKYIVKYRLLSNSLSNKSYHLVSIEIKYTLDAIIKRDPSIKEDYKKAVNSAYLKLHYYDAVNLISQNDFIKARQSLRIVIFNKWQYSLLYLLLFLPLSNAIIMKMLNK